MSLIKCEECGKEYSEFAEKCPNCGCPSPKTVSSNRAALIITIIIALIVIIPMIYAWYQCSRPISDEKSESLFDDNSEMLHKAQKIRKDYIGIYTDDVFCTYKFGMAKYEVKRVYNTLKSEGRIKKISSSGLEAYFFNDTILNSSFYAIIDTEFNQDGELSEIILTTLNQEPYFNCYGPVKKWVSKKWGDPIMETNNESYWFKKGIKINVKNETVQLEDWMVPEESTIITFTRLNK